MSNIQKLHHRLAEHGVIQQQAAGTIPAPVDNREPLTVGLVQINNSFSGQNYLPYSAGLLQSYVQHHAPRAGRYEFLLPVYKRSAVNEAVAALLDADVVGFSAYVWNFRL